MTQAIPSPGFDVHRFDLSNEILESLRARSKDRGDALPGEHEVFRLDGGLGPAFYLTPDGRVLKVGDGIEDLDTVADATGDEITIALVVGAKKTGIVALLDLLPPKPKNGATCSNCNGSRWAPPPKTWVCGTCSGKGWVDKASARPKTEYQPPAGVTPPSLAFMSEPKGKYWVYCAAGWVSFGVALWLWQNLDDSIWVNEAMLKYPRWSIHELGIALLLGFPGGILAVLSRYLWLRFRRSCAGD